MGESAQDASAREAVGRDATRICLVRHGETDWNHAGRLQGREDVPLNDAGRAQAERCAAYLAAEEWDRVVASPLLRAWETAAIIARGLGLGEPEPDAAFLERDYGAASGRSQAEVDALFPGGDVPGMESRASLRRRAEDGLRALARRHPGERIVVVAHGGVINAILAVLSGDTIGSGKTVLRNACLSIVNARGAEWEIELYNSASHLDQAGGD